MCHTSPRVNNFIRINDVDGDHNNYEAIKQKHKQNLSNLLNVLYH